MHIGLAYTLSNYNTHTQSACAYYMHMLALESADCKRRCLGLATAYKVVHRCCGLTHLRNGGAHNPASRDSGSFNCLFRHQNTQNSLCHDANVVQLLRTIVCPHLRLLLAQSPVFLLFCAGGTWGHVLSVRFSLGEGIKYGAKGETSIHR